LTPKASGGQCIDLESKLNKSASTMKVNLDKGFNKILTHAIPRDSYDVINKTYIDDLIAKRLNTDDLRHIENKLSLKINKGGDLMAGNLDLGLNKITSMHILTNNNDLVNKNYLEIGYIQNIISFHRMTSKGVLCQ